MNYDDGERVKLWGRARVVLNDNVLFKKLTDNSYAARVEQAILFNINAWDANRPRHIPKLVHADNSEEASTLRGPIAYLEAKLEAANIRLAPALAKE